MDHNISRDKERISSAIDDQRKWIEDCEKNGESYKGERGSMRRKTDLSALSNLENRLAMMKEKEG